MTRGGNGVILKGEKKLWSLIKRGQTRKMCKYINYDRQRQSGGVITAVETNVNGHKKRKD